MANVMYNILTNMFVTMQLLLILWFVFNRSQPTGSHKLTAWFALVSLLWLMKSTSKRLRNLVSLLSSNSCLLSADFWLLSYVLVASLKKTYNAIFYHLGRLRWGLGMDKLGLFSLIWGFSLITILNSPNTQCLLI